MAVFPILFYNKLFTNKHLSGHNIKTRYKQALPLCLSIESTLFGYDFRCSQQQIIALHCVFWKKAQYKTIKQNKQNCEQETGEHVYYCVILEH